MKRRIILGVALLAVITFGSSGCMDKFSEPFKDAPRSGVTNTDPADVVTMPDGFSNVATKCDHGNRLYTAYHQDSPYAAIFVVPHDPTCKG